MDEKEELVTNITKWKKKYESITLEDRPKSVSVALSECSAQTFSVLQTIYLVTPVGSLSCE